MHTQNQITTLNTQKSASVDGTSLLAPFDTAIRRSVRRALVADDDPEIVSILQKILTTRGYEVATARDGLEAWVLATSVDFDLLITDLQMPRYDGLELFQSVRERNPDLPFIFVTGQPSLDTAVDLMNKGGTAYLPKPFEPYQVREAIDRAEKLSRPPRIEPRSHDNAARTFDAALSLLHLHYQPIVSWTDRKAFSYEALMRTTCQEVPHPGVFLDLAETLGRVKQLGRAIRAQAASDLRHRADAPDILFVNLHPEELQDEELYDPKSPLSKLARRVYLEITERESLGRVGDVLERIKALRRLGYRIAIDDIGAGYAGLNSFVDFEPDLVKLDMGLVQGIDSCPRRRKLVGSLLDLALDLGIEVVAEGVETEAQLRTLIELRCRLFQGYLFARPSGPFALPVFPKFERQAT